MSSEAPSWADQWGSSGGMDNYDNGRKNETPKGNKMAKVKDVASAGFGKAKVVASTGAQKVKSGTSVGISWVKNQYQKRTSK